MRTTASSASYRELFAHRDYLRLWSGQIISYSGDALTRVALPLYVFQITGDAAALGGMFAIQQLPWILIGPYAGVLADRWNRKRLLIAAIFLEALAIAMISIVSIVWPVFVLAFIAAAAQVMQSSTRSAATPDIVGPHLYPRATAVSVTTVQFIDTIGAALAGLVIAFIGLRAALLLDGLTFALNALLVATVHFPQRQSGDGKSVRLLDDLKSGSQFIWTNASLKFLVLVMVLRGLTIMGIGPLFPVVIQEDLGGGAIEFGMLSAVTSLGFILASFGSIRLERYLTPYRILILGSALAGAMLLPMYFVHSFPVLLVLRFAGALMFGAGNLVANVGIAQLAPTEIRGRVTSTSWTLIKAAQATSSGVYGAAAGVFGALPVISFAGLSLLCLSIPLARSVNRSSQFWKAPKRQAS
jgi:MFS family permease